MAPWRRPDLRAAPDLAAELIAVLVAVEDGQPRVLTIREGDALPSGPFETRHRSLQSGLRDWVETQTRHPLGYVEQLYTFADRDRALVGRAVSISYLGLTREHPASGGHAAGWRDWYRYFPWEDHRQGPPPVLAGRISPWLAAWADGCPDRSERVSVTFGPASWNEELVLQRYELLFEAGLIPEAGAAEPCHGLPMAADHRRILATAIARLRAKIKYRPVVFELMPGSFTLLRLQQAVEGIAGRLIHKGNFRRLIEQGELVEETGEMSATGGRPAKLFRFRRAVLAERAAAGTKLPSVGPLEARSLA